jgi:hypothetical protein
MSVSPRGPPEDFSPRLLREVWVLTGLAVFIIALRVIAKTKIRKLGCDDMLMVSALVSIPFNFQAHI